MGVEWGRVGSHELSEVVGVDNRSWKIHLQIDVFTREVLFFELITFNFRSEGFSPYS